jgi:hypothetical protein
LRELKTQIWGLNTKAGWSPKARTLNNYKIEMPRKAAQTPKDFASLRAMSAQCQNWINGLPRNSS